MREIIEVPEQPEVTLLVIQSGFDDNTREIKHTKQELVTKTLDFMYNVGNAKIGVDSFGKAFLANDSTINPIICSIGYDQAQLENANEKYLIETIHPLLNNTVVILEQRVQTLELLKAAHSGANA